jgi:hypothetical protein
MNTLILSKKHHPLIDSQLAAGKRTIFQWSVDYFQTVLKHRLSITAALQHNRLAQNKKGQQSI